MLQKALIFYCSLFCSMTIYGQTEIGCNIHLEGDVLDKENQQPIEYATIYFKELAKAVVTNEDGFFQLSDICPNKYTLFISHFDCKTDTQIIDLYKNAHIDLLIKHKNHELDAVEVHEKRNEDKLLNNNYSISESTIHKNGGNNLGTLLKEMPGINVLSTGVGISKPIITGMHSIRVVTINDGVKQEGQQWGSEHAPEIDINTAGEVIVEKGASALLYSHDAVGGLIILKPKVLRNTPGFNGIIAANVSSVNARGGINLMLEGQFKKTPNWSWRIQTNNIRAGNTRTPDYYLKNTGFNENDFSFFSSYFRPKWKLNVSYKFYNLRLGIFAGSHIGNLSDLLIAYEAKEPLDKDGFRYKINTPMQNIEHHTANLDYTFIMNEQNKMNIRYGFQFNKRQEFDKVLGRSIDKPAAEFYLYTHSADIEWTVKNKKANYKSTAGFNGMYQNNYYGGAYFIPEYNLKNMGLFSFHKYAKKRWTFQAALRADISYLQITKTKRSNAATNYRWFGLASNIGLGYQIDFHSNINLSLGSTWRAPHPVELYSDGVHHGTASVEIGNKNLKQERVYFSSIEFSYEEGTRHKVSICIYNKYITNYIYLLAKEKPVLTIRGAFPAFEYKQTPANFSGADIYYKVDLTKGFDLSQKISFVYAYNLIDKNYLPFIPPFNTETKLSYTLPIHQKIDDFKISIMGNYVARQNLTDRTQEVVSNSKGYFLLGFESGFSISRRKNIEPISIYFDIQNMLNTRYRDYMNRWRYFANEAGINFSIKVIIPFTINIKKNQL